LSRYDARQRGQDRAAYAKETSVGKSGEFYTFDQVLKFWAIDETKLKRLVSEGEIRAFREGNEMKFRKMDVENLDLTGARSEEETGVIDLSAGADASSETLTDDLIFDEGEDLDLTAPDAGMATAEISSQDTFVDEGIGMSTEPLGVDAGDMTEVISIDDDDDMGDSDRSRSTIAKGGGRQQRVMAAPEESGGDMIFAGVMAVSAIIMVLALLVLLGIRDTNVGDGHAPQFALDLAGNFYDAK
jgi:hypothetical protein